MRTTLAIDDDVLTAARAIAGQSRRSVGDVISDLARRSLNLPSERRDRNGVRLLPARRDVTVTNEMVNTLRDEQP